MKMSNVMLVMRTISCDHSLILVVITVPSASSGDEKETSSTSFSESFPVRLTRRLQTERYSRPPASKRTAARASPVPLVMTGQASSPSNFTAASRRRGVSSMRMSVFSGR